MPSISRRRRPDSKLPSSSSRSSFKLRGASTRSALAVLPQRRYIDGKRVKAAQRSASRQDQLRQVLIAPLRFWVRQNQVVHGAHAVGGAAVVHVFADVDFAADDRNTALSPRCKNRRRRTSRRGRRWRRQSCHSSLIAQSAAAMRFAPSNEAVFHVQMKMRKPVKMPHHLSCDGVKAMVAAGRTSPGLMISKGD